MTLSLAVDAAGGLAMFLLGMSMMTDGLKTFAGRGLKDLLARWTSTPQRGVLAGILVTGLVQSSSAVTVATIGFVNAGVLTLRQALGVVFGASVGTTITGWLVSLAGAGFKIEALALPMLTVGVVLRLMAPRKRYQGLGGTLAGFGLFFLGVAMLRQAFGGMAAGEDVAMLGGGGWPRFLAGGALITVVTQSSSAAVAIILTAVSGGVVDTASAAAAVIGASLGTTSTAAVAAFRATPGARRLALGHIAFNVVAGSVALALLPALLWMLSLVAGWFDEDRSPAVILALFHTTFMVLGAAIMLPFTARLASALERLFRNAEEDLSRPRYLDDTIRGMPALAISALHAELGRMRASVNALTNAALSAADASEDGVVGRATAVRALGAAVAEYVTRVRTETMTEEAGEELARALRIGRYLDEVARLTPRLALLRHDTSRQSEGLLRERLEAALAAVRRCLALAGQPGEESGDDLERKSALGTFEAEYQQTKGEVLAAVVRGAVTADEADALLDALSAARRLVQQLVKADRLLRTPALGGEIEREG